MTDQTICMDRTLRPLAELDLSDAPYAGRKAAVLGLLLRTGFSVPDGFVLSAGDANLSEAEVEQLLAAARRFAGRSLAVRSSGVAEDLPNRSYAGQYDTVLNVRGDAELVDAVHACLVSAKGERVRAYAGEVAPAMAVLVQEMVPADAAGVAFTANPVTGARDEVIVNAVRGLGDRLVGGEATPEEWVVRAEEAEQVGAPRGVITHSQAREVAALAYSVEALLGHPVDIEWALADGSLHLLQARPITALPQHPHFDPPGEGTWVKDTAHFPEPLSPFGASVYIPAVTEAMRTTFADFGLLLERMEVRSVAGELYGQPVPVGGRQGPGPAPPWWLMGLLARVVPPLRARMKAARRAVRSGLLEALPQRWENQWRDEFRAEAQRLQTVDLAALSHQELQAHLDEAILLLHRGQYVHFQLFIPYIVTLHDFVVACRQLLGWTTPQTMELLGGLSEASSEPARALAELAEQVRGRPAALEILEAGGPDVLQRLSEADPEVSVALGDYLDQYGVRPANNDPGSRTLFEQPQLVASLLRDAAEAEAGDVGGVEERRQAALTRARHQLARRSQADRRRFEQALAAAERTYPQREDNVFWTDNVPCGLIRLTALEVARRLVAKGGLDRVDAVAFLTLGEVREALRGAPTPDLGALVSRRHGEQEWVAAHPGPPFHGPEPTPPPDVRGLPAEGRRLNAAILWAMGEELTPPPVASGEGLTLTGAAGSPGTYTGPARVIRSEAEFDRLRPGEVLVCPITTSAWSILFANAGALVTDSGSILSHPAIIAREHAIPAVLATNVASRTLRDGQIITVDGTNGIVELQP